MDSQQKPVEDVKKDEVPLEVITENKVNGSQLYPSLDKVNSELSDRSPLVERKDRTVLSCHHINYNVDITKCCLWCKKTEQKQILNDIRFCIFT